MSHPTMGAWIEIDIPPVIACATPSHPTMGAWIEIFVFNTIGVIKISSHPTMGAWIEICQYL